MLQHNILCLLFYSALRQWMGRQTIKQIRHKQNDLGQQKQTGHEKIHTALLTGHTVPEDKTCAQ